MNLNRESIISEVVTQNYRLARVFEKYRIDFCCNGKRTIAAACAAKGVDAKTLLNDLVKNDENGTDSKNRFDMWEPGFLAEYIVNNHHSYIKSVLPGIYKHVQKVAKVHGENHPELAEIEKLFMHLGAELETHMLKEEKMLFPYIKYLEETSKDKRKFEVPPFGAVDNPISMMEKEHRDAGEGMEEIQRLSNNYTPPENACRTYRVLFDELKEFQNDLHIHVHLENNILFPKAISLEKQLQETLS